MSVKKITGYTIFLKQILGKGSYGSVYVGEQDSTKAKCAIKMLNKRNIDSDDYLKAALFTQIQVLKAVKSQNIVGFYDVMESNQNYYIIQELCDSDLEKLLKQHGGKLSQEKSIKILTEICNGFLTLVREGILHRDLKPANIMMNKGLAKIGDFGFAKRNYNKRLHNQSSVGTPLYMSLEILKGQPYTSKCDIWALGLIFYELLHGTTPWSASTQFQLVQKIQNKPLKINPNLSATTKDFLKQCLEIRQGNRISWDQLFVHPIFNDYFKKFVEQNEKFENKLKKIMGDIRFMVNMQNINLTGLFQTLGLKKDEQLQFKKFQNFLRLVNPEISSEQQIYIFQKLDKNNNGAISLNELQNQMKKHNISMESAFKQSLPSFARRQSITLDSKDEVCQSYQTENTPLSIQSQEKIRRCFHKLFKALTNKNITLFKTFMAFDSDKSGQLSLNQFKKILKKLDNTVTQQQIVSVFNYIDIDRSNSIQFDEFNSYYCKVNGIPLLLDLPPEYHALKMRQNNQYYQQMSRQNQKPLQSSNEYNRSK